MNNNREFQDIIEEINTIAKGLKFKNGIDWAEASYHSKQLTYYKFKQYARLHDTRNSMSHGGARDIVISNATLKLVKSFKQDILRTNLKGSKDKTVKGPKLPSGTFRGNPYYKEFNRVGKDGEQYYFKFSINKEENYLDDGYGGSTDFGYFIHIESAPYFNYAKERLHQFHIISTPRDYHICWNENIKNFEDANAVMFVWVKRYCDLIDVLKENKNISEEKLLQKANKKSVLPAGTFRKKEITKPKAKKNIFLKSVNITSSVYNEIINMLGKKKPELGGMLGYTSDQNLIDNYIFDKTAKVNSVEYNPNIEYLNNILENEWEEKKINLAGFVHSHPGDFNKLSFADVEYAIRIMKAFNMKYIFMPIVTSSHDYITSFTGYIVNIDGEVKKIRVNVVADENSEYDPDLIKSIEEKFDIMDKKNKEKKEELEENNENSEYDSDLIKSIEEKFDIMDKKNKEKNIENSKKLELSQDYIFARISNVIDLGYMKDCSIIGIGCGGSRRFYEDMARMGVENFFLIDGDKVSLSNVSSQGTYISEVGKNKPEIIKDRLLDINQKVKVKCFNFMLNDEIDDNFIENEIISEILPKKTLVCAFTDDFFAQSRASRIALKYRIPFISGEHHKEGETSELIFWYPNITKYSRREIAKTRYESFENGYINDVTSVGSPIFNTTRLNSLCEKIGIGMLLFSQNPSHKYCEFLRKKPQNNLIIIKQKYIKEDNSLFSLFNNGINDFFDEVSWIKPEDIEDLSEISLEEGTIMDTRKIFGDVKNG